MVFFNYATMQMAAKIVYYGPGLCGKTTNLHVIYGRTAPTSRGEMVCLETETDRTLFFDLLPLDVGVIGGFKTRLQLYTVPGQVFYNTTRKLVLKGVDGIVFVADSQRPMAEPNVASLKNLRENLAEIGLSLEEIPRVLQFNKRDLSNVLTFDELNDALNPDRSIEWYEASATNGTGVFETLKAISKLTLRSLRSRMSSDVKRPSVVSTLPTPTPEPAAARSSPALPGPIADAGNAAAASALRAEAPDTHPGDTTMSRLRRFKEFASGAFSGVHPAPDPLPRTAPSATVPFPEAATGRERAADDPPPVAEEISAEVSFSEVTSPQAEKVEPAVKHVRVRSNVDIMSELEKLRKLSTLKPTGRSGAVAPLSPTGEAPRAKSSGSMSIDDLLTGALNHKKGVAQSFDLSLPKDALTKSSKVTIGLSFTDNAGGELVAEKRFAVDLSSLKDVQKLLLSLKFNVQGE